MEKYVVPEGVERFHVIACHVLWRELCHFAALSPNVFDFTFLEQGLHNTPDILRERLQAAVDAVPEGSCSAILVGYGLCSNGILGVVPRHTKLVVIKGHDCITHLLGSKERYREYFDAHPGTYWYSPGWIDQGGMPGVARFDRTYQAYVEQYGEENAKYLIETEHGWMKNYSNAAYVDLGFGDPSGHRAFTQECAEWLGWTCDLLEGDPALIQRFLAGDWDPEDTLVVEPGEVIAASHDETIIVAKTCE